MVDTRNRKGSAVRSTAPAKSSQETPARAGKSQRNVLEDEFDAVLGAATKKSKAGKRAADWAKSWLWKIKAGPEANEFMAVANGEAKVVTAKFLVGQRRPCGRCLGHPYCGTIQLGTFNTVAGCSSTGVACKPTAGAATRK